MSILDLPQEVVALAFELAITECGIGHLPVFALVCKDWHLLVKHTPRLWGIIDFSRSNGHVKKQLQRAKAAPLSLAFPKNAWGEYSFTHERRSPIFDLAHNWVKAELYVDQLICVHKRSALPNLEVLTLSSPCSLSLSEAEAFFEDDSGGLPHNKIHSFTASALPREWIKGFLGPSIRFFRHDGMLEQGGQEVEDTHHYLSRITNAMTIELEGIRHKTTPVNQPSPIRLPHLRTLSIRNVMFTTQVLNGISAPELQTLSLDSGDAPSYSLGWGSHLIPWSCGLQGTFFTQWASQEHLPTNLHTLDLRGSCMTRDAVPFLALWLRRLPNLARLIILSDDIEFSSYPVEANLFDLLATPRWDEDTQQKQWCLPKLMYLHIETMDQVCDTLRVVRSRNGSIESNLPPARVRFVDGILCCDGAWSDWEELQTLVDHVCCLCLGCMFSRTM